MCQRRRCDSGRARTAVVFAYITSYLTAGDMPAWCTTVSCQAVDPPLHRPLQATARQVEQRCRCQRGGGHGHRRVECEHLRRPDLPPGSGPAARRRGKRSRTRTATTRPPTSPRPPGEKDRAETRDGALDDVLVEAIETIRAAVASAAGGDDPFVLNDSTITISFAVTAEGTISIGVNGSLSDELTHTLVVSLVPAQGVSFPGNVGTGC